MQLFYMFEGSSSPQTYRDFQLTRSMQLNMFHTRPAEPENDFIVTSPAKIEDLGKYNAFGGPHNWYFCKNCGAQCFGVGANWVQEELNVGEWAGGEPEGSSQKVSRTTALTDRLNSRGHPVHYVSANAVTIEGVDLIEWHEKKWIFYVENRVAEKGKANSSMRFGKPHPRGCY
jgi:hypothetical protein